MSKVLTFLCSGDTGNGIIDVNLIKINNPYEIEINYKRGDDEQWKPYLFNDKKGETITLGSGGSVSFSGSNKCFSKDLTNYYSFITKRSQGDNVDVGLFLTGDILALTNQESVIHPYEFFSLFKDCKDIVDAQLLTLGSNELRDYCYSHMFTNCTSLTATPSLPAEKLAKACYLSMFEGCTNLTITPLLPAQKLADKCYEQMFEGCIGLISAYLPASSLVSGCYRQMFYGCTELTNVSAGFVSWHDYHATQMWLSNVSPLGQFTCLSTLNTNIRNNDNGINDRIPPNWNIAYLTGADYSEIYGSINTVITITQTYWPGDGLILSNVDGDQTFSVDPDWLSSQVENLIIEYINNADISLNQKEYKAGTGLSLVGTDTFVLTGTVLSGGNNIEIIDNKINCTIDGSNIAAINELENRIQTIENDYTTSDYVTNQINNITTDISQSTTTLSGQVSTISTTLLNKFNNYYSSTEVDTKLEATSTYIDSTSTTLNNNLTSKIDTASTTLTSQTNYLSGQIDIIKNDYTTSAYVTGQVNDLATGAVATNTSNISELSSKLDDLDIPTDLGDLTNDAGYLKVVDLPPGTVYSTGVGLAASGESNNIFYLTGTVLKDGTLIHIDQNNKINFNGTIPSKISELTDDSEFITSSEVDTKITNAVSSKVSKTDFDTVTGALDTAIGTKVNSTQVKDQIEAYGYQTATDVSNAISNNQSDINTQFAATSTYVNETFETKTDATSKNNALTSRIKTVEDNYTTSAQVSSIVEGYGYITGIQNNALISDVQTASGAAVDAATGWVNGKNYLTDHQSLDNYYNKTEVNTISSALSTAVTNANYQNATQVSDIVESYNYITAEGIPNTYALKTDIPVDYTTSAQVSSIVEGYGFITGIENNALISDVQTASGNAVNTATGWVDSQGYLTEHQTFTGSDGIKVENNVISITGEVGKTYTGTEGIKVDNNTNQISLSATIPTKVSELTNDSGFVTVGLIENRQKVKIIDGDVITFDPYYHIFKTQYAGGEVTLNDVIFGQYNIENDVVTTFEQWITFNQAVTTVVEGNNILVGALPGSLDNTKTHVFIRRIFKHNNTIKQCISYAYYF